MLMFQEVNAQELKSVVGGKDYKVSCEASLYNNKGRVGSVSNIATVQTLGQAKGKCMQWVWDNKNISDSIINGKGYVHVIAKPKKGSSLQDMIRY